MFLESLIRLTFTPTLAQENPEPQPDSIVAWVDETPITRLHIQLHKMLAGEDFMLENSTLQNIILARVAAKYLKEKDMLPEESSIEEETSIYAMQYDMDRPPYILENGEGPLKEAVRDMVYLQSAIQLVKNYVIITTGDMKKFYEKNPDFFVVPEKYKISFAKYDTREEALEAKNNGDIAWSPAIPIDLQGLTQEIRKALQNASPGEVIGPFEKNGAYFLVKYVEKVPPKKPKSFEDLMENDEFSFLRYRAQSKLLRERYLKELKSILWPYYKQTHITILRKN